MRGIRILAAVLLALCLCGCCGLVPQQTQPTEPTAAETTAQTILPLETTICTEPEETETVQVEETLPPQTELPETLPEPEDHDFVRIKDYIPDIVVELRYAADNNFTGQQIYEFTDAYLRYGTVKKLQQAQEIFREQGLSLKIWDAFRPPSAQFTLWEVYPDARYVANPNGGFSPHSRGNTVDVTLVDANGTELTMPTDYDDFTYQANRDYSDCTAQAAENARLLEQVMEDCGFDLYYSEWWHFSDTQSYDVEKEFDPAQENTEIPF